MKTQRQLVLRVSGSPKKGIMAALSTLVTALDGLIISSDLHREEDRFFLRKVIALDQASEADLRARLEVLAASFCLAVELIDVAHKPRVTLAVSRLGHCLYDLLHRWRAGLLPIDIPGVVSNHDDMRSFVEWNGLPFHHLPMVPGQKAAQEARFLDLVERDRTELVVLARYMQILSPEMCERLAGRCINIHHSFLPSFKGARPYHQAHGRGVKIIGATAHFVTNDLDEGPIIEQDVQRVHHGLAPDTLVNLGRDIECRVLARAVGWYAERRIFLNGVRTVVFS